MTRRRNNKKQQQQQPENKKKKKNFSVPYSRSYNVWYGVGQPTEIKRISDETNHNNNIELR